MSYHEKTSHAAKGKWRGILLHLGVPSDVLRDKHGPCPLCGGKDRFRFDNREGMGTYICGVCGAGDGMKLAVEFTKRPFQEVATQIDHILGNVKMDAPSRPKIDDADARKALRAVWSATVPVAPGDLAHTYFAGRHIDQMIYAKSLRFGAKLNDGEGGVRPCVVAIVSAPDGTAATLHRTFLKPDGSGKADMQAPRKMMPGEVPDGCCIRLSDWTGLGALGIAEGIETAMSASALYDLPVWSAVNASMMAKWTPPEGCEEVAIFGDNDPKFAGQAAAYQLARRLAAKGIAVTVHIPMQPGTDWADEWTATRKKVKP